MKMCLFLAASALFPLPAVHAEMREFKNQKGVVIKAEPLVVRGTNVVLKQDNGREVAVAIKTLSREDQDFVLRWMVHDPKALSYNFDCHSSEKTGETTKQSSRLGKLESTEKSYEIKINNRCQNPIDDCKVAYRVFLEDRVQDSGQDRKVGVIWKGGLLDLGKLSYNQSTSISTNSHAVQKVTPNSLAGFAGVDVKTKKDQMRGVWIKFYRHGVEVAEWKPAGLPKCEWPESPAEKTVLEADAAANLKKASEGTAKDPGVTPDPTVKPQPSAPVKKLNSDDLPQELKIFELDDTEKK